MSTTETEPSTSLTEETSTTADLTTVSTNLWRDGKTPRLIDRSADGERNIHFLDFRDRRELNYGRLYHGRTTQLPVRTFTNSSNRSQTELETATTESETPTETTASETQTESSTESETSTESLTTATP